MPLSFIPDPLKICRAALNKFETGVNAIAAEQLDSKHVARALNRISRVSLSLQNVSERSLECLYKRLRVPSRGEVIELASALQRVEDKIDQLTPQPASVAVPRPARTRRPPVETVAEPKPARTAKAAGKPKVEGAEAAPTAMSEAVAP
ncbi:hypothetical protein [Pseudomonas jinjuensis]|uniref:Uncharacterized protein n=1 Tax=Pseudomonas jinjuensis TaxID=198616 RepID=A0A1H0CS55_9PSED|nr:hypothetical protein [Pseudomonas jinjuensis]SDN60732.1 hypothetical protein SAMN05216193_1044 [Pseudomonas jinjuensis]